MPYLVLIQIAKAELSERMTTMRMWLDHMRWEPEFFRLKSDPERVWFEVEFAAETHAASFADAFGGEVLGEPVA